MPGIVGLWALLAVGAPAACAVGVRPQQAWDSSQDSRLASTSSSRGGGEGVGEAESEAESEGTDVSDVGDGDGDCALGDDVESGVLDAWELADASYTEIRATSDFAADGTTYSLTLSGGAGDYRNAVWMPLGAIQPSRVAYWVRAPLRNAASGYVILYDTANHPIVWTFLTEDGRIRTVNSSGEANLMTYSAQIWYHVEWRNIDWAAGRYDIYIDEELKGEGLAFDDEASPNALAARISVSNHLGARAYWDEIEVCE